QYGPDGALWTGTDDGRIIRYEIAPDGNLHSPIVFDALQKANGGPRLISGFCFDPTAPANKPAIYVSHSFYGFEKVPDFTGAFTRMSGENLSQVQDLLIHLPRSYIDHLNFQPAFGPDGAIYFAVGSSSAFGAPDNTWGMRPEHPLTASVLRVDLARLPSSLPLDVKATADGGYDPKAPGAPVTVYATGVRVAYDLVWHSNGKLYAPVNGSSSGGNSPEGPGVPALTNIPLSEHDWLMMIEPGRYYGHPNPTQGHYVLNGGNPTAAGDFAEVAQYPIGTQPDPLYTAPIHDFGKHVSANGAVEIRSSVFDGKLRGMLAVCRYNCGSDIMFFGFNPDGTVKNFRVGLEGTGDLASPLDVTENPNPGVLYVSEYAGRHITMLRPIDP
ncbi:MAG TPA: PQQ-dependent sugar dehydrogenase, partial [Tepidisphaeraceae bacterium]|nr:PQQ-dependent sugar dehydrogenase [Tepidisphaeraceae bacterium]